MGTILKTSTLTAAVFIGLLVGVSNAQDILNARIPFSFVVGSEEFPAGRYEFRTSQAVLTIRGRDNGRGMFAITQPADGLDPKGDQPLLVFSHYENSYRLTNIWNSQTRGSSLVLRRARKSTNRVTSNTDQVVLITLTASAAK
ncbi:MAG TPA: hypothetical protein VKC35_05565 [Vicinamibacterales bacterium]|nr:hypothetical protein [Vicinamibacterales bacterium]